MFAIFFRVIGQVLLRFGLFLVALLAIGSILLVATDNGYIFRAFTLTYLKGEPTANIDDHVDFDTRTIKAGQAQLWEKHPKYNQITLTPTLTEALDTDKSVAFVIIKDGKLLYEKYWDGYSAKSKTNSFSMAKSVLTMLYLKAVEDGYISSINAPVTELLPEYKNDKFAQTCTLADLSGMTAGYDWSENYYFPINPTAKSYYGDDLTAQIVSRPFVKPCGEFEYLSGVTQLLGIAVSRALEPHGETLTSYLSKQFWQPLGMQYDGVWSLDGSAEIEKVFCCIAASALDFAKFGQLMLNAGEWQGKPLLSKAHIDFMITPNKTAFAIDTPEIYGHAIWTDMDSPVPFYAMLGHLGQRVLVLPDDNAIIVRLGKQKRLREQVNGFHLETDLGFYVSEVHATLDKL